MTARRLGVSAWAQETVDHVTGHMDNEREALRAYGDLALRARDPRVRMLVEQILDDEIRHHQQFDELRAGLRAEMEGRGSEQRGGDGAGAGDGDDPAALLRTTEELLALEKADLAELRGLAKRLRQVEDTAWRAVVVDAMELDTRKHVLLLEAVADLLRAARR